MFFYFFACLLGPDSLRSTTSVKWVTFSKKQTRRSFSRFPSFLFYTHMITIISTSWTGVTDIHPGASWEGTGGIFRHTKIARCIYTKESPFPPPPPLFVYLTRVPVDLLTVLAESSSIYPKWTLVGVAVLLLFFPLLFLVFFFFFLQLHCITNLSVTPWIGSICFCNGHKNVNSK